MKSKKYYDKVNSSKFLYLWEYHKGVFFTTIFLFLFSFVFIVLSLFVSIKDFNYIKSAEKTTAVVVEKIKESCFRPSTDSMTGQELTNCVNIYVRFNTNGIEYKEWLNGGTLFMNVGDEISIYYQIKHTIYGLETIEVFRPVLIIYISMYLGAMISLIIGIIFFKKNIKKINKEFVKLNLMDNEKNKKSREIT